MSTARSLAWFGASILAMTACSSSSTDRGGNPTPLATSSGGNAGAPTATTGPGGSMNSAGSHGGGSVGSGGGMAAGGIPPIGMGGRIGGGPGGGAPPAAGSPGSASASMGGAPPGSGGAPVGAAGAFTGPLDGDPAKPQVAIQGVPCGPPKGGFGAAPPTVKITMRDVVIAYPCAHEGAAVTFFLFLHGTLQEAQKVPFTMNAFAIHELVDSHNIVLAVPKAIGTQWGNGDNGQDLPHLYEVVDWVYATFGTKFNIRSMWSQGGSWGAAYLASTFACDPKFQDRLKGIQLIVGGGCPRCSNRLSCIVGQQELQLGNGMALSEMAREMAADSANIASYAMGHGCDAKMGPANVGNVKEWTWPNCDKGWTHAYYLAPGQHADTWDKAAVLKMTEEMTGTEQ
jgi:hypothetical protein